MTSKKSHTTSMTLGSGAVCKVYIYIGDNMSDSYFSKNEMRNAFNGAAEFADMQVLPQDKYAFYASDSALDRFKKNGGTRTDADRHMDYRFGGEIPRNWISDDTLKEVENRDKSRYGIESHFEHSNFEKAYPGLMDRIYYEDRKHVKGGIGVMEEFSDNDKNESNNDYSIYIDERQAEGAPGGFLGSVAHEMGHVAQADDNFDPMRAAPRNREKSKRDRFSRYIYGPAESEAGVTGDIFGRTRTPIDVNMTAESYADQVAAKRFRHMHNLKDSR